ncbi:Rad9-domain-containing protein [Kalaharituber pfeilii]|nr:Rad9-domain-containing protein [Kalaharituber pfeilii]
MFRKIEYVTIEASRSKLCLIALNSSKSAHASVNLLCGRFFDSYHFVANNGRSLATSDIEANFSCSIQTKALLSVFRQRYVDSKDKDTAIEKCEVTLGDRPLRGECRLLVRFICKHGVVKTYKLTYEDVDVVHAIFDKNVAENHWAINAKLLKEYVEHFGPKAEQLNISGEDGRATLTSYTEKLMDGIEILKQPLHTAVSMDTVDFEEFTVEEGLHITINLKDFKAIINHADSLGATVTAYYSAPGRPLQIQYDRDGMRCEFTLMTTGNGARNPQSFTRTMVLRTRPAELNSHSQSEATTNGQRPARLQNDRSHGLEAQPSLMQLAEETASQAADNTVQTYNKTSEQELSLFFDGDESMETKSRDDDKSGDDENDNVLGWDIDMDHTQRTGPRIMQSRGEILNDCQENEYNDGDDYYDDEEFEERSHHVVGPTQQVSQARGLFD